MNDLEKVFLSELKDIYDGEQQLVQALPKMEQSAHSGELKRAFREHCDQTKTHVSRLETVFRELGEEPRRKTCKALEGIIDEGELVSKEFQENTALDAALIGAGQKAEHYEITTYGTLCSWAEELGKNGIASVLRETLTEEKVTDGKLTQLAEAGRNRAAVEHDTEKKSELSAKFKKMVS